ncbi:MAG: transposase [Desulfobacterales bacterium]
MSCILSTTEECKIALFLTGRQHAGENMEDILKQRTDRSPPIQMCDALAGNVPKTFETVLANCLAHGRRQFVDMLDNFPEQCGYVLETLAEVYKNDEVVKERLMNAEQRLCFHQQNSGPLMDELNTWFHNQLEHKTALSLCLEVCGYISGQGRGHRLIREISVEVGIS